MKGKKPKKLKVDRLIHEIYFVNTQSFKPKVILMDGIEFSFDHLEKAVNLHETLKLGIGK